MNNRALGTQKEREALQYLKTQGMEIKQCNFRCKQGEIDIIGLHQGYLVFVEVKYRKSLTAGTSEDAVHLAKQVKICRVSDYYRYSRGYGEEMPVRYDVVAINKQKVEWYQNAFEYIKKRGGRV